MKGERYNTYNDQGNGKVWVIELRLEVRPICPPIVTTALITNTIDVMQYALLDNEAVNLFLMKNNYSKASTASGRLL